MNQSQQLSAKSDHDQPRCSAPGQSRVIGRNSQLASTRLPVEASRRWHVSYRKLTAFHIAGHVAAMYLHNQHKSFPPIFFHTANDSLKENGHSASYRKIHNAFIFSIECGLVSIIADAKKQSTVKLEQDVLMLLAGPLAEARYVHSHDNEPLTRHLVNPDAVHYYGGSSDLVLAHECLERLPLAESARKKKLTDLFSQTFDFVSDADHWRLISRMARYIDRSDKSVISYQEIIEGVTNKREQTADE